MDVKTISINCESCGAGLNRNINNVGKATCKCDYCGNLNLILSNGKTKVVIGDYYENGKNLNEKNPELSTLTKFFVVILACLFPVYIMMILRKSKEADDKRRRGISYSRGGGVGMNEIENKYKQEWVNIIQFCEEFSRCADKLQKGIYKSNCGKYTITLDSTLPKNQEGMLCVGMESGYVFCTYEIKTLSNAARLFFILWGFARFHTNSIEQADMMALMYWSSKEYSKDQLIKEVSDILNKAHPETNRSRIINLKSMLSYVDDTERKSWIRRILTFAK